MPVPEWVSAKSRLRPVPSNQIVTESQSKEIKDDKIVVLNQSIDGQKRQALPRKLKVPSSVGPKETSQESLIQITDQSQKPVLSEPSAKSSENQITDLDGFQSNLINTVDSPIMAQEHNTLGKSTQPHRKILSLPGHNVSLTMHRNERIEYLNDLHIPAKLPEKIAREKYENELSQSLEKHPNYQSSFPIDNYYIRSTAPYYEERNNHSNSWHMQVDEQDMVYAAPPTNQKPNKSKGKELNEIENMLKTLLKRTSKCERSSAKKKRSELSESSESYSSIGESDLERKRKAYKNALNDYKDTKRSSKGCRERKSSHSSKRHRSKSRYDDFSSSSDDDTRNTRRQKTLESAYNNESDTDDLSSKQRKRMRLRDSRHEGKILICKCRGSKNNPDKKFDDLKERRKSREISSERKSKKPTSRLNRKQEAFEKAKKDLYLAKEASKSEPKQSLSASNTTDSTEVSGESSDNLKNRRSKHSDEYGSKMNKKDERRSVSCETSNTKSTNKDLPKVCTSCININSLTPSQKQALCYIQKAFAFSNVCQQPNSKAITPQASCTMEPSHHNYPASTWPNSAGPGPAPTPPPSTTYPSNNPGHTNFDNTHPRMKSDCSTSETSPSCNHTKGNNKSLMNSHRQSKNSRFLTKRYSVPYSELSGYKGTALRKGNNAVIEAIIEENEDECSDDNDDSSSSENRSVSKSGEPSIKISYGSKTKKSAPDSTISDKYMKRKLNDILEQTVRLQKKTEEIASSRSKDYPSQCYIPVCCPQTSSTGPYQPQPAQQPQPCQPPSFPQYTPNQYYHQPPTLLQYPHQNPQHLSQPSSQSGPQPQTQSYPASQSSSSHYPPTIPTPYPPTPPCTPSAPPVQPSAPSSWSQTSPQQYPTPCPPPPPSPQTMPHTPCHQPPGMATSATCKECTFNYV